MWADCNKKTCIAKREVLVLDSLEALQGSGSRDADAIYIDKENLTQYIYIGDDTDGNAQYSALGQNQTVDIEAHNGTSVDSGGKVVLGNDVGATDGQLVNDREIPLNNNDLTILSENGYVRFKGDGGNNNDIVEFHSKKGDAEVVISADPSNSDETYNARLKFRQDSIYNQATIETLNKTLAITSAVGGPVDGGGISFWTDNGSGQIDSESTLPVDEYATTTMTALMDYKGAFWLKNFGDRDTLAPSGLDQALFAPLSPKGKQPIFYVEGGNGPAEDIVLTGGWTFIDKLNIDYDAQGMVFGSDTQAGAAGLVKGDHYGTPTGEVRYKL